MKPILIILFLLLSCQAFSQSSHDGEIMQIKGKWAKNPAVNQHNDPALYSNQYPVLIKQTDAIAELLKEVYPNPTGMEAIYYPTINESPLFKGAPAGYWLNSYYKSYYFNIHTNKILLGDETETWVTIYINEFGNFMHDEGQWMIDGNPITIYTPWQTDGEWKGSTLYKNVQGFNKDGTETITDKAILLGRKDKLPFISLTQKQYLEAIRYKWNNEKNKIYTPDQADKDFQKSIDAIKSSSAIKPEMKEKMIEDMQNIHARQMQSSRGGNNSLTSAYDKKIKIIDDYLSTHSAIQLQQPVVTSQLWDFPGYFGADRNKKVYSPVRIDPGYFNTTLPRYTPQFIVMQWTIGRDVAKMEFGKKLESDFPVNKLKKLLDGGKDQDWSNEPVVKGPDMIAIRKRAEKYADSIQKNKYAVFIPPIATPAVPIDTSSGFKIPPRNEKMLGGISATTMSPSQLKPYLEKIDQKYSALLHEEGIPVPNISSLGALDITYAATFYLLSGSSYQAAWCAIKAAEEDPDDILVLTNSGGVLNACGFQPIAIPILQTALDKSAGNSTIQNNLGQAYLELGDKTKADSYLRQSLQGSPNNPHANFSMACIEYAKGNNSAAQSYVEKSLKTSFTDGAMHLYYKLNPHGKLWNILKDNYKPTDYFNEDKYHLLPQCRSINDVERLKAEYKAYRGMLERVKKQFDEIRKSENELGNKSMMEKIKDPKSGVRTSPFNEIGALMVYEINLRLKDEQDRLARAQNIYNKEIHDLNEEYKDAEMHAESCAERLALSNAFMESMSMVTEEYQKTWLPVYREYFDDMGFWGRVQTSDKHLQRAAFAAAASGFLGELLRLAETHFLNLCDPEADLKKEEEDYVVKEPDCGIDIELDIKIGSFKIDCEKMEYHFGAFIVADVVHTYKTHCTSIAIGAGFDLGRDFKRVAAKINDPIEAGPLKGGFSATGKMQYFITFDGTRPSDQGFIWEAGISYSQKFKTEIGEGTKIDGIQEVSTNKYSVSQKTVFSVVNGFKSSGPAIDLIDKIFDVKPEKQENKNVKIFNSSK